MKRIRLTLTKSGIDRAIKQLEEYQNWLDEKVKEFTKALADEGMEIASLKFNKAAYDGTNDVQCEVQERDNGSKCAVVAVGNAALFIEFGTGISNPEIHPEMNKLILAGGVGHGEYGYRLGRMKNGWRYWGEPGTNGEYITQGKHVGMVHTYGNPANMCMYETVKELQDKIEEVAKKVFV